MKKYPLFSEMKKGDKVSRPFYITDIQENKAKNGSSFVKITMKDEKDSRTANMFDTDLKKLNEMDISANCIAAVSLDVGEYNNFPSYTVRDIKPNDDNDITIKDFITLPPIDCDLMFNTMITLLEDSAPSESEYTPISKLAITLLKRYEEDFKTSSAAISMHHNLRGGLLYHSYRMMLAADALSKVYTILDRELLLSGAALHDIGKMYEYNTTAMGDASMSVHGALFGHLFIGAEMVMNEKKKDNYDADKVNVLAHMICSHHSKQEWGAIKPPATAEAHALYFIDDLDAKMYSCEKFYEDLAPGKMTEKRPFGFDNNFYRPKFTAEALNESDT